MTSEVLARRLKGTEHHDAIANVVNAADRLSELLNSLLDYSQSRLGMRMNLLREQGNLAPHLQAEIALVRAANPQIHFGEDIAPDLEGSFDVSRVREALSNLLSNAVQYSERGSPILIMAKRQEGAIRIDVTNRGDPIPDDEKHMVFEPLRRAGAVRRSATRQNMGIGLFIVCEVVRAHDGKADVASADGLVTFWMELPSTRMVAAA